MSDKDELREIMAAAGVADALRDGDFDAFADLAEVLKAGGTKPTIADFALAIIWALLPDEAVDKIVANAQAEGKSNVIDLRTSCAAPPTHPSFTRRPR